MIIVCTLLHVRRHRTNRYAVDLILEKLISAPKILEEALLEVGGKRKETYYRKLSLDI